MPDYPNYPPQFANSAVSAMIGQINDLSGTNSKNVEARKAPGGSDLRAGDGVPVPVVITGTSNPREIHFPGLRETMIGAAIVQLAEQLDPSNELGVKIRELALELHRSGGAIIAKKPRSGKK